MPEPFTREQLSEALEELGALVRDMGKVIDIAIYGGSCLMLASNFRMATADVDAVAITDQAFIDDAARTIAARHGLAYENRSREQRDEPPRYLGRSRPSR